jgi:replication factor C subunit 3/5
MITVLHHVAKRERFKLPDDIATSLAKDADGNVRKAVLMLEALKMQQSVPPLYIHSPHPCLERKNLNQPTLITCSPNLADASNSSLRPAKPDWETYCYHVADMIVQEQTPKRVMEVRTKLYELLSHCIPPTVILKVRMRFLLDPIHSNHLPVFDVGNND